MMDGWMDGWMDGRTDLFKKGLENALCNCIALLR